MTGSGGRRLGREGRGGVGWGKREGVDGGEGREFGGDQVQGIKGLLLLSRCGHVT